MSDKSVPGNRQDVSELVNRGELMSLQDVEHEQLKAERGQRIRSRRDEMGYAVDEFCEATSLSPRTITDSVNLFLAVRRDPIRLFGSHPFR